MLSSSQCEKKEEYIERIQTLDFETKAAIAAHIQEVAGFSMLYCRAVIGSPCLQSASLSAVFQLTHSQENVLDLHWLESDEMQPEEMETVLRIMASLLRQLLDQRDTHLEVLVSVYFIL